MSNELNNWMLEEKEIDDFIKLQEDEILKDSWEIYKSKVKKEIIQKERNVWNAFRKELRSFKRKFDKYKTIYPTWYRVQDMIANKLDALKRNKENNGK